MTPLIRPRYANCGYFTIDKNSIRVHSHNFVVRDITCAYTKKILNTIIDVLYTRTTVGKKSCVYLPPVLNIDILNDQNCNAGK